LRPLVLLPSASAAAAGAAAAAAPRRPTALTRASPGDAAGGAGAGSNGSGSGGSGRGSGGKRLRGNRAREPGLFEIKDVSPPPRSLGVYALPPNTHTQDVIELRVDPSATEDWQATGATAAASAAVVSASSSSSSSDDDAPADDEAAVRRYIVTALVLQFKLVAGRYRRDHSRLEVQPVGRYLTNLALESAFRAKPYQKNKGEEDDGK
jgi:hypothetical protein